MGGLTDGTDSAPVASGGQLVLLWRRVKEHRIAQWTVGYVAVAYGIQHAVTLTSEALDWPHAATRLSFLLLALGLPVAMTLAWYHGERASRGIGRGEMAIVSVMLVGISLAFFLLVRPAVDVAQQIPAAPEASVTVARQASLSPKGAISVVVLPFSNMSGDASQEFFSDGMTEEITAALAKVPDLRVVARTSAFEFKGKNVEIGKIGEQLHATHLIEGSVRKAGNRVRITAQLIRADDGTHIWAENYDRELTDVFAIQEDIARAITASLHMTLGLKPGENLVNNRKIDAQSYETFLRAKALYESRTGAGNPDNLPDLHLAASLLENVVAKNPSYAPGWGWLGAAYGGEAGIHAQNPNEKVDQSRALITELRDKGEAAEQRAVQLDPSLSGAYGMLGAFKWSRGKLAEADELFARALAADGENTFGYSIRLGAAGYTKKAGALMEKAYALEPLVGLIGTNTAAFRWIKAEGPNPD
jgi:TolB-like protein